jgi:hypothetical protein
LSAFAKIVEPVQDAAIIDDSQRGRNELDTHTTICENESRRSDDSVELGMPHEPLSITFFKNAFSQASLVGLTLPQTTPEGRVRRRLSPVVLEGLEEESSQALELPECTYFCATACQCS